MAFSQVTLIGNLGRDPEMSYTPDGTAVTKFSLAISKKRKVKGETEEATTWYNCTAFRSAAETLNTYVKKGSQLFVQGELDARQYTTRDGKQGTSLDVIVDKFSFIGSKREEGSAGASGSGFSGNDALGDLDEHPF